VTGALAGLADFWWWGYRYGHDLDPHAAIQVQGMTYQPPLIGSKVLLNITAHSWPAMGGWAVIVAVTLVIVLAALAWRRPRPEVA